MKKSINKVGLTVLLLFISFQIHSQVLPKKNEVLDVLTLTNRYFMDKWSDVGQRIVTTMSRASNIWTRAVYYEGLVELYKMDPRPEYYDYMVRWGEFHEWNLRDGNTFTRNADNQCAGQVYIDLYHIDPQPERVKYIKMSIDSMMKTDKIDDWNWIDAIQMAMPVFAQLGKLYNDKAYYDRMHAMYMETRDNIGGGLYNKKEGLWWRDADFVPPYKEPNGKNCYWSRGNGWVIMALVRVMDIVPKEEKQLHKQYLKDYKALAKALIPIQREDGFWNVSLHDPNHYGGKETSGTAMFVYGMAWGINNGILSEKKYKPIVLKAWNAMVQDAVHENGFLGYVQSTGKEPKDGQPVTYDKIPDFEDYGLGAFLLAGSEVYKMAQK